MNNVNSITDDSVNNSSDNISDDEKQYTIKLSYANVAKNGDKEELNFPRGNNSEESLTDDDDEELCIERNNATIAEKKGSKKESKSHSKDRKKKRDSKDKKDRKERKEKDKKEKKEKKHKKKSKDVQSNDESSDSDIIQENINDNSVTTIPINSLDVRNNLHSLSFNPIPNISQQYNIPQIPIIHHQTHDAYMQPTTVNPNNTTTYYNLQQQQQQPNNYMQENNRVNVIKNTSQYDIHNEIVISMQDKKITDCTLKELGIYLVSSRYIAIGNTNRANGYKGGFRGGYRGVGNRGGYNNNTYKQGYRGNFRGGYNNSSSNVTDEEDPTRIRGGGGGRGNGRFNYPQ